MAQIKKFTGFNELQDNSIPLRKFIGFSAETLENFTIRVVDNLGNLVPNSTIEITYGGVRNEYLAETGSISLYIENPINVIRVNAFKECLFGEEKIVSHGGDGFFVAVEIQIAELPCLETTEFNTYNFLRFRLSNNLAFPITEAVKDCTNCNTGGAVEGISDRIPNAYAEYYDRNLCKKMFPIIVRGEEYKFVINKKEGGGLVNFSPNGLAVCLVDQDFNQIQLADNDVYLTPADPNGEKQYYGRFSIGAETLQNEKKYRVVIYQPLSGLILFASNFVRYIQSGYGFRTVYLQYRNSSGIDGYAYRDIPEDFYNSIRLEITRIESQPEIELTQYQEESTGKIRNQKTQAKKVITLESYFFEELAHDAMLSLSLHDDIKINNKQMTVKTAYQVETSLRNNLAKGTIEMYDQSRSSINLAGKQ